MNDARATVRRWVRRIYVASSWRLGREVLALGKQLRGWGHDVFMFCEEGDGHFVFDARNWQGRNLTDYTARQMWLEPAAQEAYRSDKAGLDWADTVVLLLPSGRSAHLEAGYGVGQGKDLYVIGEPVRGEFDIMYGFAKAVCETTDELRRALKPAPQPFRSQS